MLSNNENIITKIPNNPNHPRLYGMYFLWKSVIKEMQIKMTMSCLCICIMTKTVTLATSDAGVSGVTMTPTHCLLVSIQVVWLFVRQVASFLSYGSHSDHTIQQLWSLVWNKLKIYVQENTWTRMFITASFIIPHAMWHSRKSKSTDTINDSMFARISDERRENRWGTEDF